MERETLCIDVQVSAELHGYCYHCYCLCYCCALPLFNLLPYLYLGVV